MKQFQEYVERMGLKFCMGSNKYCSVGKLYCIHDESAEGVYWYYETADFIVDIHNFFVKKEKIIEYSAELKDILTLSSSYIVTANGESFTPYQPLTSNMLFMCSMKDKDYRFILHANCPYLSIGINFKDSMFQKYLASCNGLADINAAAMFFESREQVLKPLSEIALSILNCTMAPPAAAIFFEAKAKEWLSITLDAYINKARHKPLSQTDELAIESVASYISDHYSLNIPQELLEKIAMMSGTKLKSSFRQKYGMSITEYTQRKRMNIAETLLLTSSLEIGDIAKAVGYASHSKFSTYFKKYKGVYPKEIRKIGAEPPQLSCC